MKTLNDVKVFIEKLYAEGLVWHADDLASECISHLKTPEEVELLQAEMYVAIAICEANDRCIFDFYLLED